MLSRLTRPASGVKSLTSVNETIRLRNRVIAASGVRSLIRVSRSPSVSRLVSGASIVRSLIGVLVRISSRNDVIRPTSAKAPICARSSRSDAGSVMSFGMPASSAARSLRSGARRNVQFQQPWRDLLAEETNIFHGIVVGQQSALTKEQQMPHAAHACVEGADLFEHLVRRAGEYGFCIHELLHTG